MIFELKENPFVASSTLQKNQWRPREREKGVDLLIISSRSKSQSQVFLVEDVSAVRVPDNICCFPHGTTLIREREIVFTIRNLYQIIPICACRQNQCTKVKMERQKIGREHEKTEKYYTKTSTTKQDSCFTTLTGQLSSIWL